VLPEHAFDIGFVVDNDYVGTQFTLRAGFCADVCSRQPNDKFREHAKLAINVDSATARMRLTSLSVLQGLWRASWSAIALHKILEQVENTRKADPAGEV